MAATYIAVTGSPTPIGIPKTKVYIGTTASSPASDTFTEIADIDTIPGYGSAATPIKVQTVGSGEVTIKGVVTYGGGDLQVIKRASDAGQVALAAAGADFSGANYNLRLILPNKATSTGTGEIHDVKCLVMGAPHVLGSANGTVKLKFTLGFNSDVTVTAAV